MHVLQCCNVIFPISTNIRGNFVANVYIYIYILICKQEKFMNSKCLMLCVFNYSVFLYLEKPKCRTPYSFYTLDNSYHRFPVGISIIKWHYAYAALRKHLAWLTFVQYCDLTILNYIYFKAIRRDTLKLYI